MHRTSPPARHPDKAGLSCGHLECRMMEIRRQGIPRGDEVVSVEFKADAVALYLSDPARTYASVARGLGINRETLRLWVKEAARARTAPPGRRRRARPGSLRVHTSGQTPRHSWPAAGGHGASGRNTGPGRGQEFVAGAASVGCVPGGIRRSTEPKSGGIYRIKHPPKGDVLD
ncbi:transposase [Streptosporangium sp. NPDC049376]|uniref:transposase n=1 Tax=Streptosporangium sp. NPDC049376 TaxID=3366192 RepID=UPI0037A5CD39